LALWRGSQELEAGEHNLCALSLPPPNLPLSYRNELIPFSGALVFAGAAKGHLYITWLWWPAGLMLTNPTGL